MIRQCIATVRRATARWRTNPCTGRWPKSRPRGIEPGQATTEYALILLVAAVIATLVITWATVGGGSGRIGELFDTILDGILERADTGAQ